jgi:lipopolysaccharide/colanic/teichoic acid biosynthesis glycosyltransferase
MEAMRRFLDLLIATLVVIITAPLMIIIAITIRLESGGPILYRRRCVGLHGQHFDLLRFRTMVDTPGDRPPDERLTPVGRFIRNYSLDELPLLLNVLRGEMSIIGPRPTEPRYVDLADPGWQRILSVRPGVISYAVLGLARDFNTSSQPIRMRRELDYLRQRSLRFDLQVLRKGVRALIASRGNVKARGWPSVDGRDVPQGLTSLGTPNDPTGNQGPTGITHSR